MPVSFEQFAEVCTRGSDAGTLTFPQVVGKLIEAGVERYLADLTRGEKTYYQPSGASHVVASASPGGPAADRFDAAGVEAAIRASQARAITYAQFCEAIAAAGCVGYVVSLTGRRAVYFGRSAETHIEPFPPAP
jgi:uncharacterized protein YbcV (DUF1398 family)